MIKGKTKLFVRDNKKLALMLRMRRRGFSFPFLARLFQCDESSVRTQCAKYQVVPKSKWAFNIKDFNRITADNTKRVLAENPSWMPEQNYIFKNPDEKINKGKNYKEYLAEANKPKQIKQLNA